MMKRQLLLIGLVLTLSLLGYGCKNGGNNSLTGPQGLNLTGIWSGPASDSGGDGFLTWDISQNGNSIDGTVSVTTNDLSFNGTVTGTVSGSTLTFTMTFVDIEFGCTSVANGTATVTVTTINGTYSGNHSCNGPYTNGQLSLTKQ
jgi:hypothetical protein